MSEVITITVGRLFALESLFYILGFAVCLLALFAYKKFSKRVPKSRRQQ